MGEYAELTAGAENPDMKLEPIDYFQRKFEGRKLV